jgi:hypothetical protein
MQDRPSAQILLEAIQDLIIKEILPEIKNNEALSYKTLVSWNMLGIISREIKLGENFLNKEIQEISELLKSNVKLENQTYLEKLEIAKKLNQDLASFITSEKISVENEKVWNLVKKQVKEKLEISNPRYNSSE